MVEAPRTFVLTDGRRLGFDEFGDAAGRPIFFFHGTPGSRLDARPLARPSEDAGVRLISPDRPGYGHSTPHPSMTVAGWAQDVLDLADSLGIDRFAVAGVSGGGPYALACAAVAPQRVWAAAVIAGAPPPELKGDPSQMHAGNRLIDRMSANPALARALDGTIGWVVKNLPGPYIRLGLRLLPPADRGVMADPQVQRAFRDSAPEQFRQGAAGLTGDHRLDRAWGFSLADIRVPVLHWHGEDDRNVPVMDGKRMADAISTDTFQVLAGEGHLLLPGHWPTIVAALVDTNS